MTAITDRLDAIPSGGDQHGRWVSTLKSAVLRVLSETEADDGMQNADKWKMIMSLSRAGSNGFWAMSMGGGLSLSRRAGLMRLALTHGRLHGELNAAYTPMVRIREASDSSGLLASFYGGSVLNRELLTERAKADVSELMGDVLSIDAARAETLLARIPDGVVAWR